MTITGSAVCDEAASNWVVTWTIANNTETPMKVRTVAAPPGDPITTVSGIAAGDTLPAGPTGTLTATSTVRGYLPTIALLDASFFTLGVVFAKGQVTLPSACGHLVMPTVEYESGCEAFVIRVAMPADGDPVLISTDFSSSFRLEPGGPPHRISMTPNYTGSVRVWITGYLDQIASGRWEDPGNCLGAELGSFQLFASANSRYLAAQTANAVLASSVSTRPAHTAFDFVDAGSGYVAIRAVQVHHLLTVSADSGKMVLQGDNDLTHGQMFQIVDNADGTISLRSRLNGKYVTAERAGAEALIANRTAIGPWEKFTRYAVGKGPGPLEALANYRYVTAESAGRQSLIANRGAIGLWEYFQMIDLGNGAVALKSQVNGKYVCAESAGRKPLIANRTAIGPWEKFSAI